MVLHIHREPLNKRTVIQLVLHFRCAVTPSACRPYPEVRAVVIDISDLLVSDIRIQRTEKFFRDFKRRTAGLFRLIILHCIAHVLHHGPATYLQLICHKPTSSKSNC